MRRLRTREQFQAVLAGTTVSRSAHFALHRAAADPESAAASLFVGAESWVGALLPKRWARRAVTRNTIRRQIYSLLQSAEALPRGAWVVRQRAAFPVDRFPSATSDVLRRAVREELQTLFGRAKGRPA